MARPKAVGMFVLAILSCSITAVFAAQASCKIEVSRWEADKPPIYSATKEITDSILKNILYEWDKNTIEAGFAVDGIMLVWESYDYDHRIEKKPVNRAGSYGGRFFVQTDDRAISIDCK